MNTDAVYKIIFIQITLFVQNFLKHTVAKYLD